MFFMEIKTRGVIMYKKKILTMSFAVGLGALTAFGISAEKSISADTVQCMGDVDNDGFINAVDATSILVEYAGGSTGGNSTFSDLQKTVADIDKNGIIDAVDATYVLRYYAYTSTGGKLDIESWTENLSHSVTTATTATSGTSQTTASSDTVTTVTTVTTGISPVISDIRLTRYDIDIPVGGKDVSYVVMSPEDAPNKSEIWTTSDEKIATVDGQGYITGVSEGDCIVTVTSADNPSVKAEIKVKVCRADKKVKEIKLSKYNMNLSAGEKDISYVTMLPENVANKNEIWTTSDEKIAVVDTYGNITGVSDGICTVTVTSVSNPEIKADITVVVSTVGKISRINLSKTEMNISVGDKDISYVTMLPENVTDKSEIWTSSDEKIAVVDMWGNVTGVSAGTCVITVASADNPKVKADIKVTVSDPNKVSEIKLSRTEMNISVGEKDISYVTMLPENVADKGEIWTTSDEKIAVVDKFGNITGVSEGTCIVTVASTDNPSVKADIKVTVTKSSAGKFQQINGCTYIDGILIANKSYSLPSVYDPGMDATAVKQFYLLSDTASKEGLNIYISSGYRSYSYQEGLYNNYVSWYGKATADTFSARAGHSEHQTGLAIDVNSVDDSFAGTPESVWLANHAHEFGFIIRYPEGKENITGYKYEPWHIRYLGVEKATEVYNSGLTLEEYLGIDSYYH